jgi:hypothetical protein
MPVDERLIGGSGGHYELEILCAADLRVIDARYWSRDKTSLKETGPAEQTHFDLEEPILRPVPIPRAILQILKIDPAVLQSGCPEKDHPPEQILASWFEASPIHLHAESEVDVIVKARNGCLFGANIGPFWVFKSTAKGYEQILSTAALAINVLQRKSNGYRNISAAAVVAGKPVTVLYKFDGQSYQEAGSGNISK